VVFKLEIYLGRREMRTLAKLFGVLIVASIVQLPAKAQELPGKHPGYIHALSDLRSARWFLNHQAGDPKVYAGEDVAITEIDAAIAELKKASIDDGKDLNTHPAVDVKEHGSRLLRAMEVLQRAHDDINSEEDNPEASQLRHRALDHIQKAHDAANRAHAEWLKDMGKK
jgi:hypothetical protein